MMYDVEKPELKIKTVKPNFEYRGPAHLSDKSKKRMKDFKYGDVLYCDEYGLNGDESGEAVAICMKTKSEKDKARFISLKYASTDHPDTGTDDTSYIPFCMNGIDLTYITTQEEYYYYLNDSDNFIENNWNTGHLAYVHDSIDYIYAPIIVASYRYHTPGTKKGQWFCPNDKDYEECFVNVRGSI